MEKFDGSDYTPEKDDERLDKQIDRVKKACRYGIPMSLAAIAKETGDPEASISAQLRHLRKAKHGAHTVNKIHISHGLYLYQVTLNDRSAAST
jgi:hypothetical protein|tara:strand:+ start:1361 stop:1639 length:279 start_codon:yes stop_codon:yes gene_type:complete